MVSSEGSCKIWHEYGGHLVIRGEFGDRPKNSPNSGSVPELPPNSPVLTERN
jgi:hypothetical protein